MHIQFLKDKASKSREEIKALHSEYLNKIGNLTIIKGEWKSMMSNRLFDIKKGDYLKSEFQITKELVNYEKWTFDEIISRAEKIVEEAYGLWRKW